MITSAWSHSGCHLVLSLNPTYPAQSPERNTKGSTMVDMSSQPILDRLSRIIVLSVAIAALGLCPAAHGQTTELARFVGRDLWKDGLSESESHALTKFLGEVPKGYMLEPAPWHVWQINRDGQTRYVVLLGQDLGIIPGGTSACFQLFDANGKRMISRCFQTGWRNTLAEASIDYSTNLASDLVVLHTHAVINGRPIAKEYFAISHDRIRLIRLESSKGDIVQNEYVFPNYEIGFVPEARTIDDWAGLLQSKDLADVLAALTFLGGRHLTEPERHFDSEPQKSQYSGLFQQLIGSPRIRELIAHLETSDNEWVRQAAALAARGPRERPLD
jgi:hypothetical protein